MIKATVSATETASNMIQTSDASVLLQTLRRRLTTVMEGEVSAPCGAGYEERSNCAAPQSDEPAALALAADIRD